LPVSELLVVMVIQSAGVGQGRHLKRPVYILGCDGGPGTGFLTILSWYYQDYPCIIMWIFENWICHQRQDSKQIVARD